MTNQRGMGKYFTVKSPFDHPAFYSWASDSLMVNKVILEPFAGSNSLIGHLERMGLCNEFRSFDIDPSSRDVVRRDTINSFPTGYSVCVTNPPWLAKNSATYRGLPFPDCDYDNVYKLALSRCLAYCEWVAALVPESFIRSGMFRDRMADFISMPASDMFIDTDHPVGMALFCPDNTHITNVWSDLRLIGDISDIESTRPRPRKEGCDITFNDPCGNVGIFALDSTEGPTIRFCHPSELGGYAVKPSGRHVTIASVYGDIKIQDWNDLLQDFRITTFDSLMTCYKGKRKDGMYRRRLDWDLARGIIHELQ